jgi:hypothetical protein
MRFKNSLLISLTFVSFLLILLSFRPVKWNDDQDDRKKPPASTTSGANQKQKNKAKDSLIGVHSYYLEMRGVVRKTKLDMKTESPQGIPLDSAEIKVYVDSTRLVAVHYADKHGDCKFKLPLNRSLRLEISKPGFLGKIIDVNSKVPPDRKLVYIFPFDIDLFEFIPDLNAGVLKHPIAKVKFDLEKVNFEYDQAFTNSVNRDLKILYKTYREKMSLEQNTSGKK